MRIPPKSTKCVDAVPIDHVAVALAPGRIGEQRLDEVDAGLNGHNVAGGERQVGAQVLQPEAVGGLAPGKAATGVVGGEPDHVAKAMGEEQCMGVRGDKVLCVPTEDAEVGEPTGNPGGRGHVEVLVFDSRSGRIDGGALGRPDEVVEVALDAFETRADGKRAGHIRGIATELGGGIDEDNVAETEFAGGRRKVEYRGVGPATDDGTVGRAVAAAAKERRLDLDLQLAFGHARPGRRPPLEVALDGGACGGPHAFELGGFLGAALLGDELAKAVALLFIYRKLERPEAIQAVATGLCHQVAIAEQGHRFAAPALQPGEQGFDAPHVVDAGLDS